MGTIGRSSALGPLEDDPVYQLIVASNELIVELNEDIMAVHKYVADLYSKKFPELESMVTNPLDYFNVVKEISNEMVCPVFLSIPRPLLRIRT
jgi:U4/U6 small nuclear ribonucleoprotein PRP31